MDLLKVTPFGVAYRTWLARPPRPSLTVVVKGSFDLVMGDATIAADQPFPEGERWIDDDVERALATPGDLAPFKRRGECLVLGSCHPPGGRATRSQIAFSIGAVQKNIAVFGDRTFEGGLDRPAEFTSMPLTWERAFGGRGHAINPAGVELPNLEDPQQLIQGRGERPAPTCTTPISPLWPERLKRAGTYDAAWLAKGYPGLASDIDWDCFAAAPPDQRIEGWWRGDEELVLVNLVPGTPSFRTRLPGVSPRAFLTPADSADPLAHLWEVPLRLDTIVVETDVGAIRCVWRGVLDVMSEDLEEMGSLCVLHDEPGMKRSAEACRGVFEAALVARRNEERALEADAPTSVSGGASGSANEPLFKTLVGTAVKWSHLDQAMTVDDTDSAALRDDVLALLKKQGLVAEPGSPLASILDRLPEDGGAPRALDEEELRTMQERMLAEEVERMRGEGAELRKQVQRALYEGQSCAGWDLSGVDLSRLRLSGGDFRKARFRRAILAGTIFGGTDFADATFEECEISDAQLEEARLDRATFHFCRLERTHFRAASLDDARFTECLLRGARFSQSFGRRAELLDSRLDDATFDDAVFDGADLTGSVLDRALLARTSLVDVWMIEGVSAKDARFDRCDLRKLRATGGTDVSGSTFAACYGPGARFNGAIARKTDFSFSDLERASFTGADLRGAVLMGCRLRKARFDDANAMAAKLLKSDLFEARLERANLRGADLRGASLYGAELLKATLDGAKLDLANLDATRLAK